MPSSFSAPPSLGYLCVNHASALTSLSPSVTPSRLNQSSNLLGRPGDIGIDGLSRAPIGARARLETGCFYSESKTHGFPKTNRNVNPFNSGLGWTFGSSLSYFEVIILINNNYISISWGMGNLSVSFKKGFGLKIQAPVDEEPKCGFWRRSVED